MTLPLIDTHAHLYGEPFAEDLHSAIERATEVGVEYILLSNVDRQSHSEIAEVVHRYPHCLPMIGLHPTSVELGYQSELEYLRMALFAEPYRYIAVGEIGLDYYWSTQYRTEQQEAFRTQLLWANQLHLPVSLHTRNAVPDAVAIIKELSLPHLRGVFHSFTGTAEELQLILSLENFMVGINGVVTFKNSNLGEIIQAHLPLHRLVLETDCPYLSPVPKRGRRNEPAHLPYTLQKVAELYHQSPQEVALQLYQNSAKMFQLPPKTQG